MKRTLLTVLVAAGLIGSSGLMRAQEKTTGLKAEGYLGLGVESVSPALSSQLAGVLAKGQGVLVDQVAKDSSAARAGLQTNDILLSYNDQKLYSPEQLVKLVRGEKPGHEVAVSFLRGGKTMACKVTLGHSEPSMAPEPPRVIRMRPDEQLQKLFDEIGSKKDESSWDLFDALKLTRLDSKRWRAEVEYRSTDGKKDTKAFTGTRDEIRKAIQSEKDLPDAERTHLLRALNLQDPIFEFHFPAWGPMPPGVLDRP